MEAGRHIDGDEAEDKGLDKGITHDGRYAVAHRDWPHPLLGGDT